jgi:hypothetical protein
MNKLTSAALGLFLFAIAGHATPYHSSPRSSQECHKLGDEVTIKGRAAGLINGGTYFEPLKPLCVDFPKNVYRGVRFNGQHLTTVGEKVTPDRFVEVTGILRDAYPEYGVAIEVKRFRDVDSEVKASIAEEESRCQQWRRDNTPILEKKTHGGRVSPYEAGNADNSRRCGLIAADRISHEVVTLWMPEPSKNSKAKWIHRPGAPV